MHRGIDHYAKDLKPTAIHQVLTTGRLKLVVAYLSPARPWIESDITENLNGRINVLTEFDLNAKHTD